jgi:hypothetical protein
MGTTPELASDASNLPSVLHLLSSNPRRYERYMAQVRRVIPSVRWVSPEAASSNEIHLKVWHVEKDTERSDLAVTLAESGTGLGQVLAILYVATMSETPRLLLVDEPQSFLHPGAARELVQILSESPHQCLVTTHSPEVISAVPSCALIRVDARDDGAHLTSLDPSSREGLRSALTELGLRVSDMFGPDRILWVEGQTEEACLPIICSGSDARPGRTSFHAVKAVGDFVDRKHARLAFSLYVTLTQSGAVLAPTVGFLFDRERMSDKDAEDLQRLAAVPVRVLRRRMLESYLLDLVAISEVLSKEGGRPVSVDEIASWVGANLSRFLSRGDVDWLVGLDAARLLEELFSSISDGKAIYRKVRHGVELCRILSERDPGRFADIREDVGAILGFAQ